jgi:hypothetical protein
LSDVERLELDSAIRARQEHTATLIEGCNWATDAMVSITGGQGQSGNVTRSTRSASAPGAGRLSARLRFMPVLFEQKLTASVIIVHEKILNHGSALTLHNIRLTSESDSTLSLRPSNSGFPTTGFTIMIRSTTPSMVLLSISAIPVTP